MLEFPLILLLLQRVFMDGWSPAMYDEFPGSSNGRKYPGEGDDSTINDEDEGVMRAGYTNNYGYGATEGAPPTDSENERGNTPNHYPGPATKVCYNQNIKY